MSSSHGGTFLMQASEMLLPATLTAGPDEAYREDPLAFEDAYSKRGWSRVLRFTLRSNLRGTLVTNDDRKSAGIAEYIHGHRVSLTP